MIISKGVLATFTRKLQIQRSDLTASGCCSLVLLQVDLGTFCLLSFVSCSINMRGVCVFCVKVWVSPLGLYPHTGINLYTHFSILRTRSDYLFFCCLLEKHSMLYFYSLSVFCVYHTLTLAGLILWQNWMWYIDRYTQILKQCW